MTWAGIYKEKPKETERSERQKTPETLIESGEREKKVKHTREIQLKDKDVGAVGVEGRAIKTDRNEDGDTNRNTNQPPGR